VNTTLDNKGLEAFDARNAEARDQAAALTLAVSLEQLDKDERARFEELAVFPEDVDVPLETVTTLWGQTADLDEIETEDLCIRFFDLSLLWSLDLTTRHLRLHDVVRTFLLERAEQLSILDAGLVAGYRDRAPQGWTGFDGSDRAYLFRYLPEHLRGAGLSDELRTLLFDFPWLLARLRAIGTVALDGPHRWFEEDAEAKTVGDALRLSAHVLARDSDQLAGQLIGRLLGNDEPSIAALLKAAEEGPGQPWLCPQRRTLTPPGGPLLQMFQGHSLAVNAVAVTADGTRAVSGSDDQTVKVWDLARGELVATLEGRSDYVNAVAVTADGTRAVSGSHDHSLRVWDLATRTVFMRFDIEDWVTALATNGKVIIAGDRGGRVHVLEIRE